MTVKKKILLLNRQKKIHLEKQYLENGIGFIEGYISKKFRSVNVILVGNRVIKSLNKQFLNKNSITDVLSFNLGSRAEVVISVDTANDQATDASHTLEMEILYLIIHGVLHLSGFDDAKPDDYITMKKQQDKIFSTIVRHLNAKRKKTGYC